MLFCIRGGREMKKTVLKQKLTLWVPDDIISFGKKWAKNHKESISQLFSEYLIRLRDLEEETSSVTPIVKRLSGVSKNRKLGRKDYREYLSRKYSNA